MKFKVGDWVMTVTEALPKKIIKIDYENKEYILQYADHEDCIMPCKENKLYIWQPMQDLIEQSIAKDKQIEFLNLWADFCEMQTCHLSLHVQKFISHFTGFLFHLQYNLDKEDQKFRDINEILKYAEIISKECLETEKRIKPIFNKIRLLEYNPVVIDKDGKFINTKEFREWQLEKYLKKGELS